IVSGLFPPPAEVGSAKVCTSVPVGENSWRKVAVPLLARVVLLPVAPICTTTRLPAVNAAPCAGRVLVSAARQIATAANRAQRLAKTVSGVEFISVAPLWAAWILNLWG